MLPGEYLCARTGSIGRPGVPVWIIAWKKTIGFYTSTSTCISVVEWIERAGWLQWPKTRWTGLNVFLPLPCFLEMYHRMEWCALSLSMLSNARLCNSAVSKCDRLSASAWSIKDNQVKPKVYMQNLYSNSCLTNSANIFMSLDIAFLFHLLIK